MPKSPKSSAMLEKLREEAMKTLPAKLPESFSKEAFEWHRTSLLDRKLFKMDSDTINWYLSTQQELFSELKDFYFQETPPKNLNDNLDSTIAKGLKETNGCSDDNYNNAQCSDPEKNIEDNDDQFRKPEENIDDSGNNAQFSKPEENIDDSGNNAQFSKPEENIDDSGNNAQFSKPEENIDDSGNNAQFSKPEENIDNSGNNVQFSKPEEDIRDNECSHNDTQLSDPEDIDDNEGEDSDSNFSDPEEDMDDNEGDNDNDSHFSDPEEDMDDNEGDDNESHFSDPEKDIDDMSKDKDVQLSDSQDIIDGNDDNAKLSNSGEDKGDTLMDITNLAEVSCDDINMEAGTKIVERNSVVSDMFGVYDDFELDYGEI